MGSDNTPCRIGTRGITESTKCAAVAAMRLLVLDTIRQLTPVDVSGLSIGVSAIATGVSHTCALTASGGVKCWGFNGNGRLGDGSTTQRLTAVDVSGLTSGVSAIAPDNAKLAALVPPPRAHLTRFHGVFTPGILPSALRASLRLFKFAPGEFVPQTPPCERS